MFGFYQRCYHHPLSSLLPTRSPSLPMMMMMMMMMMITMAKKESSMHSCVQFQQRTELPATPPVRHPLYWINVYIIVVNFLIIPLVASTIKFPTKRQVGAMRTNPYCRLGRYLYALVSNAITKFWKLENSLSHFQNMGIYSLSEFCRLMHDCV